MCQYFIGLSARVIATVIAFADTFYNSGQKTPLQPSKWFLNNFIAYSEKKVRKFSYKKVARQFAGPLIINHLS